ncbi:MAG: hypothetical protein OXC10_04510 [Rhodospirillaceae bacterium]|nr:hypothetical protein [Rhodospirillaceae bacterium]
MLECDADEPLKARVFLNLQDQGFPGDALVAIEAYRRSSAMRFDCGTVNALNIPDPLILSEVDQDGSVLFRLKVIDRSVEPGKLLGSAESIRPKDDGDSKGRRSLLPIDWLDIGDDVWKVEIEHGDRPTLIINYRISASSRIFLSNPIAQGVLFPAALRFILQELASSSDTGESEDGPKWEEEWLEYCRAELGIHDDPRNLAEESEKKNWVDYAVKKFCKKKSFIDGMDRSLKGA